MIYRIGALIIAAVCIFKCVFTCNNKLKAKKIIKKAMEFSNIDKVHIFISKVFRFVQYVCIFMIGD